MQMKIVGVAAAFVFAVAIAPTSRLIAQSAPPTASQNAGQQGEYNGDHEDAGAAAIDNKGEPAEIGESRDGKETPEATASEPAANSSLDRRITSPDRDRSADARADSTLDEGQHGDFTGNHEDTGTAASPDSEKEPIAEKTEKPQ